MTSTCYIILGIKIVLGAPKCLHCVWVKTALFATACYKLQLDVLCKLPDYEIWEVIWDFSISSAIFGILSMCLWFTRIRVERVVQWTGSGLTCKAGWRSKFVNKTLWQKAALIFNKIVFQWKNFDSVRQIVETDNLRRFLDFNLQSFVYHGIELRFFFVPERGS